MLRWISTECSLIVQICPHFKDLWGTKHYRLSVSATPTNHIVKHCTSRKLMYFQNHFPDHCKQLNHTGECDPRVAKLLFSHFSSCRIIKLRGPEVSLHKHKLRKLEKINYKRFLGWKYCLVGRDSVAVFGPGRASETWVRVKRWGSGNLIFLEHSHWGIKNPSA